MHSSFLIPYFVQVLTTKTIKIRKLQQRLQDLREALRGGHITVNEYSTMYHETYQEIKNLNQ